MAVTVVSSLPKFRLRLLPWSFKLRLLPCVFMRRRLLLLLWDDRQRTEPSSASMASLRGEFMWECASACA